jgi:hypothetical protein
MVAISHHQNTAFKNSNYQNSKKIEPDKSVSIHNNDMLKNNTNTMLGGKQNKNNLFEGLMKQKENLLESKNSIMEAGIKKGDDPKTIQQKIAEIDSQIKNIDAQINKLKIEEQQKALNTKDVYKNSDEKNKKTDSLDSKSEVSQENLSDIIILSANLSQVKDLSSIKTSMSNEKRVLNSEIKIDESRGIDPKRKKERVLKLDDNLESLDESINDTIKKINNQSKQSKENTTTSKDGIKENQSTLNSETTETISKLASEQSIKQYIKNSDDRQASIGEKINAIS